MLIVSLLVFFMVIFLLAAITVAIAWMAFVKKTAEESEAARGARSAEDETSESEPAPQTWQDDSHLFRSDHLSTLSFWDNLLSRLDFVAILRARMAEAALDWSVGRVTLTMLLAGTVAGLVLLRLLPLWAAMAAGVGVGFIPCAYILRVREKRFRKFREAFPDVLDSMARALKAGYPLATSMEMVCGEAQPPVSVELRKTAAEANLGMGWPKALENLGQRIPLLEVNLFASAVALHSRTGGRLSEVMSGLAENLRETLSLEGEVRALAAYGRLTGVILTILPVGIAGMMLLVSPEYMFVLVRHPMGKNLIAAAVGCLVLAHIVIRKLVDVRP